MINKFDTKCSLALLNNSYFWDHYVLRVECCVPWQNLLGQVEWHSKVPELSD